MVKNICFYKPTIKPHRKKYFRKRGDNKIDKKDLERKFASAGPNK